MLERISTHPHPNGKVVGIESRNYLSTTNVVSRRHYDGARTQAYWLVCFERRTLSGITFIRCAIADGDFLRENITSFSCDIFLSFRAGIRNNILMVVRLPAKIISEMRSPVRSAAAMMYEHSGSLVSVASTIRLCGLFCEL